MYINRTLEYRLKDISNQFRVVLVTGPRQVGKTTMLQHLAGPERCRVTLDDPTALRLAREDPGTFFQRYTPPVLIDEIQYAPELLTYIKLMVDADGTRGRFWLTGSQQFHLMKGVSESLAGRIAILNLAALSAGECAGRAADCPPFIPGEPETDNRILAAPAPDLMDVYSKIWRGSMPELIDSPGTERDAFFDAYVQTYIQRDVRDLTRVGDEMAFLRFLRAAAARTGTLLNMADMARDTGISPKTAASWLSILQTSGLVHLLEPWYLNRTTRLIKAPKLYFLDTGLASYLTDWPTPGTLEKGALSGPILETWVVSELLKSFWHNGRKAPMYYLRDKDGIEIDVLIQRGDTLIPLEIKKTSNPGREDIRHFHHVESTGMKRGPGGVLCLARQAMPLGENTWSIPITAI
ncbi:MAG TPA: ATP-binding protein [Myxococcota bacterium]|nr:ATP-binding protein [Myxococcota bacterium]